MVLRLAARGEVRIRDAVQELAETLKLDAQARATLLPSGRQTLFANRVHWAKTYLAKAGLIQNTRRGVFPDHRAGSGCITGFARSIEQRLSLSIRRVPEFPR